MRRRAAGLVARSAAAHLRCDVPSAAAALPPSSTGAALWARVIAAAAAPPRDGVPSRAAQPHVWHRSFASSADGGSPPPPDDGGAAAPPSGGGGGGGASAPAGAGERGDASAPAGAGERGDAFTVAARDADAASSWQSADAALDAWGAAMDAGDWDRAWDIFEAQFPVGEGDPTGGGGGEAFPSLEAVLAHDPEAGERALRRDRERYLQEEAARRRVRRVDAAGRAHAVGRRKCAVARVWLRAGGGALIVNRRPYDEYFGGAPRRADLAAPFIATGTLGAFDACVAVAGGGVTGQAQAVRHGLARALQAWDPALRPALKAAGLLTRDARVVERKKPGRAKARKSFAWVKR